VKARTRQAQRAMTACADSSLTWRATRLSAITAVVFATSIPSGGE